MEDLNRLIQELCKLPAETQWIEFKHNNYDPYMIGKDISALANGAALLDKNCAYMLWGIDDESHEIVGTEYNLRTLKKGQQELESWLRALLSPNADFVFYSVSVADKMVGVLKIYRAAYQPVTFEKVDYIRVGSYTKKLNEFPTLQAQIWDKLRNSRFEERHAMENLALDEALALLDYTAYFDLSLRPQPADAAGIAHYLLEEGLLEKQDNGSYAVTNLGAILFAKHLSKFPRLERKAIRVVQYSGNNRLEIRKQEVSEKGYAPGLEGLMKYMEALLPTREPVSGALREQQSAYPMLAVREAVANALIHQDFSVAGTGPLVEVFDSRIEITNSGFPLVDIRRIIDNPPRSRNEKLAALMRRLRMCEESGSGWDKIVLTCERMQLPAPKIELFQDSTRVTLFSHIPYSHLTGEERLWACYLHACIRHVEGEQLTNRSLRERFGMKDSDAGNISRLIKDAVEKQLIKPLDPHTAPRYMKYIPIWA